MSCPVWVYLGSTGSGKSFAAKRELLNVFLAIPQDRIIVVDPMGEYAPLVERLGGQVIEIAPDSPNHISPMDVQMDMGGGDSPLSLKADFLLSLCELVVGGRDGLQPIEKTVIDRCVRQVYREMALGLETAKTPLLQDLYEELLRQPEPEAKRIATALELYCTGSLNLFNHPTNVNLNSRVVCFVLKGMGENLRKIAMHITNDFVTSAVGTNFKNGVATWCYFDEFHILLRDPLTASYFVTVWKIQQTEAELSHVSDLMAAVVQYAKTRPAFDGYKAAKYSRKYLAEHEAELADYRAAKATMAELLGGEKLPKMDVLKEKRRQLAARKKALYLEYRKAQQDMRELVAVKGSVDHLRGLTDNQRNKEQAR